MSNLTNTPENAFEPERWICIECGHECEKRIIPSHCSQCGCRDGYAAERIAIIGRLSTELDEIQPGTIVEEWRPLLPNGLPKGLSMVLRGRPGAGKSRAGYRFGSQIGRSCVAALEMGCKLSNSTARNAGARTENNNMVWYDEIDPLFDELKYTTPAVIIVDSVQKLKKRGVWVTKLRRWALEHDANLILISQKGQHGSSRHGEDDDFDCDVIIDVKATSKDGTIFSELHGKEEFKTPCKNKHAHATVAKSRVCELLSWDVPIVG